MAVGDIDNDGDLDVLVTNLEGEPMLLRNDSKPVGHWLSVELPNGSGSWCVLRMGLD